MLSKLTSPRLLTRIALVCALLFGTQNAARAIYVVAYHGKTGDEHQQQFDTLSEDGMRMISISVYGTPPRYAAVWVDEPGPSQAAFHGLNASEYEDFVGEWADNGYRPEMISVEGSTPETTVFAGVLVADGLEDYGLWVGLDQEEFDDLNQQFRDLGYYLDSLDVYGTDGSPLYAGIWLPNTNALEWSVTAPETVDSFQETFDASIAWWVRPKVIPTLPGSNRCAGLWHDDILGEVHVFHNMSSDEYDAKADEMAEMNYYPVSVQGAGSNDPRFSVVFAPTHHPVPRQWQTDGTKPAQFDSIEDLVHDFMVAEGVRAGQLAIGKDGELVYSRAFTWAEPGYPQTTEESLFRQASTSKVLTSIGIFQLIESGAFGLADSVWGMLQIQPAAADETLHPFLTGINVQHLLHHQGGFNSRADQGMGFDSNGVPTYGREPTFSDIKYSQDYGWPLPITKNQIASVMVSRVNYLPTTQEIYSNFGYCLLGLVIEQATGLTYEQALQTNLFGPLGVTRPRIGSPFLDEQPGEVRYHPNKIALRTTVMDDSGVRVPAIYGAQNHGNLDAHGGWVLTASDFVKVLASFDRNHPMPAKDVNPIMTNNTKNAMWSQTLSTTYHSGWVRDSLDGVGFYTHGGALGGTRTAVYHTDNGISFALCFNKNVSDGVLLNDILSELLALADWPEEDLFPSVGIPSCPEPPADEPVIIPGNAWVPIDPRRGTGFTTLEVENPEPGVTYAWEYVGGGEVPPRILERVSRQTGVEFYAPGKYTFRVTERRIGSPQRSASGLITISVGYQFAGLRFRRGDCNDDGAVDVSDPIADLMAQFLGQGEIRCEDACDSNDDGVGDVSDPIVTLTKLFLGRGLIPPPGMKDCGVDPTEDGLSCEKSVQCP